MRFFLYSQISSHLQGRIRQCALALATLLIFFVSCTNHAISQQIRPLGLTVQASAGVPIGNFRAIASVGLGASIGGRYALLSDAFILTFDVAYNNFLTRESSPLLTSNIVFQTQTALISFLPGIRYTFDILYAGLQAGYVLRSMNLRRWDFGVEQGQKLESGGHWVVQPLVGVLVPLGAEMSLDANCTYLPVQMQGNAFPSGAVVVNVGVQMRL